MASVSVNVHCNQTTLFKTHRLGERDRFFVLDVCDKSRDKTVEDVTFFLHYEDAERLIGVLQQAMTGQFTEEVGDGEEAAAAANAS